MKYLDEYRDPRLAASVAAAIRGELASPVRLMEVCGTHTVAIFRSGVRQILDGAVELLSGPGCPVCVTAPREIDHAVALARQPGVILTTFGDMIKVPGSHGSLQNARSEGADVRVVYSAADAVRVAVENPDRRVVFLGVGFETTAPTVALSVLEAEARGLSNYLVYSVHKLVPPALRALLESSRLEIDGLILPGHVSVVIGAEPYRFLATKYSLPAVVMGFEPLDLLQGIHDLARMIQTREPAVTVQYRRAVFEKGNPVAVRTMETVFEPSDAEWRGLGSIPASGLRLRPEYAAFDASRAFDVAVEATPEPAGCRCGEVLCGMVKPVDCGLFADVCTPTNPIGPCMVSSEGTCAAYYAYGRD